MLLCHPRLLCISHNGATMSHCRAANAMSTLRSTPTGLPLSGHPRTSQPGWRIHVYERGGISLTESESPQQSLHSSIFTDLKHHPVIHAWNSKVCIWSLERHPNSSWKHQELDNPPLISFLRYNDCSPSPFTTCAFQFDPIQLHFPGTGSC